MLNWCVNNLDEWPTNAARPSLPADAQWYWTGVDDVRLHCASPCPPPAIHESDWRGLRLPRPVNREEMLKWCVENLRNWKAQPLDPVSCKGWGWSLRVGEKPYLIHALTGVIITYNDYKNALLVPKPISRDNALEWLKDNVEEWPSLFATAAYRFGGWYFIPNSRGEVVFEAPSQHHLDRKDWEGVKSFPCDDQVKSPKHYQMLGGVESIELIASGLTAEQWKGFCLGNEMKYRFRAGKKDKLEQDIAKAEQYVELFEKFKGLTRK